MSNHFTHPRSVQFALRLFVASWIPLLAGVAQPVLRAAEAVPETSPRVRAAKKAFAIPAGDAVTALKRFITQSGQQLIYKVESLEGVRTEAVQGSFTAREALERMLSRTALSVVQDEKNGVLAIVLATSGNAKRQSEDSMAAPDPSAKKKLK